MTKNELIEELQKIKGNPQITIAIDRAWGKESYSAVRVTPLYSCTKKNQLSLAVD